MKGAPPSRGLRFDRKLNPLPRVGKGDPARLNTIELPLASSSYSISCDRQIFDLPSVEKEETPSQGDVR